MPVVFRFDSLDVRNRAVLVVPDVEAALDHIRTTFRLSDFCLDEDGEEPANIKEIRTLLNQRSTVRLHDLEAWHSQDTVEISCAAG